MLQWNQSCEIQAPIDRVWSLFQIENLPRIMPNVLETKPLKRVEGVVGSQYLQTYQEGKKVMEYVVEDLAHQDQADFKLNTSMFDLGKFFHIEVTYQLEKLEEGLTRFTYSGTNQGINWLGKLLLKVTPQSANHKVVQDFMDRVKHVAEEA